MKEKLVQLIRKKTNKITLGMIIDFLIVNKEVLLQCVLAVILYCICSYKIDILALPIITDDEYGYWANSSFFMGIEWTSITQNVFYYSYGYSFILVFVRLLARWTGYTDWRLIYQSACVINIFFIVGSFFIATRICKRYMKNLSWLARSMVCFVAMLYPANLFYSHMTLVECALMFLFWIFLYIMMRVTDKPSALNHVSFGLVVVYIYVVHQRAISVLVTAVLIAVFVKLVNVSKMRDITAFFGTVYIGLLIQAMIKKNLQNVLYLGYPKVGLGKMLSYMFTKKTALLLIAVLMVLLLLYFVDKGKVHIACIVIAAGIAVVAVYLLKRGIPDVSGQTVSQIAINDFAGQWEKIKGIFTKYGMIRLGTSIVGKWIYLAAATGLVICWGLRDLFINAFWMTVDSIKRVFYAIKGQGGKTLKRLEEDYNSHIWLLGVFLAWIATFLVCAIYKEGLYKVDDLLNGRYIEYATGILIIYSVDRLLADKHWFIMSAIFLALYLIASAYCQYVYDVLQRDYFEPAHAVIIGLLFEKDTLPTNKLWELAQYVVPLSVGFILLLKFFSVYLSKYRFHGKVVTARCIIALIIPLLAWNHISYGMIDSYIYPTVKKWTVAIPQVAGWTDLLENGEKIYFAEEGLHYKKAELIQYILMDKVINYTSFSQLDFDEDAIFIICNRDLQDPNIVEKCEVVCTIGDYAVVINKNQEIVKRWNVYKNSLQS